MLNSEKYKTAEERAVAFEEWCESNHELRGTGSCVRASNCHACHFEWLGLEADEPLPCPFCGGECRPVKNKDEQYVVACDCCCYTSQDFASSRYAVYIHNLVARAVKAVKKSEVK